VTPTDSALANTDRPVPLINIANGLTVLRIVLVPVVALTLLQAPNNPDEATFRLTATAVFLLAAMTDHWDGRLARRRGLITDFGKIADPIADKALMLTALAVLSAIGELSWLVTCVIALREIGVTVLRFAVIRRAVIPASLGGKIKTVVQIIAIALYILPLTQTWQTLIAQLAMIAALALTIATGAEYVFQIFGILAAARAERKQGAK
jgi:CDP-diacylglycerol--glycerol-3-phosphate 3-phosphatidyltransferase